MVKTNINLFAEGEVVYTDGGVLAEFAWVLVVLPFIAALIIPFADDAVKECKSVVGIATNRPNTVVTSACEIPPAICFGSPVPNSDNAWKVFIIPMIVPNRPNKGEITEINLTTQMY